MEKLAALCCLWANGLGTREDYTAELDRLFLDDPGNDFLLGLETLGSDSRAAWNRLYPFVESSIDPEKFAKELLAALETVYNENRLSLVEFGERRLHLLYELPSKITEKSRFIRFSLRIFRMTNTMMKNERVRFTEKHLIITGRSAKENTNEYERINAG